MKAGIALGSNIGDRLQNLRRAHEHILLLNAEIGSALCSHVYETEPVDCEPGAPSFLNAVMEIDYRDSAESLLHRLRAIEHELGRPTARDRNISRLIDLDLLYFNDLKIGLANLVLPHPRIGARRFVLEPLRDIRPNLILPGENNTVSELLQKLPAAPHVALFHESL